eukprot:gene1239-32584_t
MAAPTARRGNPILEGPGRGGGRGRGVRATRGRGGRGGAAIPAGLLPHELLPMTMTAANPAEFPFPQNTLSALLPQSAFSQFSEDDAHPLFSLGVILPEVGGPAPLRPPPPLTPLDVAPDAAAGAADNLAEAVEFDDQEFVTAVQQHGRDFKAICRHLEMRALSACTHYFYKNRLDLIMQDRNGEADGTYIAPTAGLIDDTFLEADFSVGLPLSGGKAGRGGGGDKGRSARAPSRAAASAAAAAYLATSSPPPGSSPTAASAAAGGGGSDPSAPTPDSAEADLTLKAEALAGIEGVVQPGPGLLAEAEFGPTESHGGGSELVSRGPAISRDEPKKKRRRRKPMDSPPPMHTMPGSPGSQLKIRKPRPPAPQADHQGMLTNAPSPSADASHGHPSSSMTQQQQLDLLLQEAQLRQAQGLLSPEHSALLLALQQQINHDDMISQQQHQQLGLGGMLQQQQHQQKKNLTGHPPSSMSQLKTNPRRPSSALSANHRAP